MDYSSYMGQSFTKLFSSITDSTIWREPDHVRLVWITLLASSDAKGRVFASVPGLADKSRVDLALCVDALDKLSSPDPWSRSKNNEGRRLEVIEGGWRLINYTKYRELRDEESTKASKREWWNKNRGLESRLEKLEPTRPDSNQEEAEEEADKEEKKKIKRVCSEPSAQSPTPTHLLYEIPCVGTGSKTWPLTEEKVGEWAEAYPGMDVKAELRKAVQWLKDNPTKGKTSRGMPAFLGRWLSNAQDKPAKPGAFNGSQSKSPAHRASVDEAYKRQLAERERLRQSNGTDADQIGAPTPTDAELDDLFSMR